jgi:hypothetical protein
MAASASTQRSSTPPTLVRQPCANLVYVCWQVPWRSGFAFMIVLAVDEC